MPWASRLEMPRLFARPYSVWPYTMPKFTALARLRISCVTSETGTPNTRAAVSAWKSSPSVNASMRPSSPERCASRRSSICE